MAPQNAPELGAFSLFFASLRIFTLPFNNGQEAYFLMRETSIPNMTGRRFHHTTGAIPRRPWKARSLFAPRPIKNKHKKRVREGCEVRHGTSSIHFHRTVPRSSSHIGSRKLPKLTKMLQLGLKLRFPFRATGPKIQNNWNRSKIGFQAIRRNWG